MMALMMGSEAADGKAQSDLSFEIARVIQSQSTAPRADDP
jgi:hypothetical protein